VPLDADQRLEAFETHLRYRNRHSSQDFNHFTDQELILQADEFLKMTSWASEDTPEDLVRRLRAKRAKKSGASRSKNVSVRKRQEAAAAEAARQGDLFA
jgi:serine phosphatase RsbU (regulator of sigma subunit)